MEPLSKWRSGKEWDQRPEVAALLTGAELASDPFWCFPDIILWLKCRSRYHSSVRELETDFQIHLTGGEGWERFLFTFLFLPPLWLPHVGTVLGKHHQCWGQDSSPLWSCVPWRAEQTHVIFSLFSVFSPLWKAHGHMCLTIIKHWTWGRG